MKVNDYVLSRNNAIDSGALAGSFCAEASLFSASRSMTDMRALHASLGAKIYHAIASLPTAWFRLRWRTGLICLLLLAGLTSGLAQTSGPTPLVQTPHNPQNRFLFIFDISSSMAKRLSNTKLQIDALLYTGLGGYLKDGDTVGVWAFNNQLHMGGMPLQRWSNMNSSIVADNIKTFLDDIDFAKSTDMKVLQPSLNDLVKNSDQLMVMIFTDGEDKLTGTPYDDRINDLFDKQRKAMRKAKQPFVLVMCSQLGHYAGADLGMPPGAVDMPRLPAWPLTPPPAPVAPVVQEKPPVLLPPLVLVGHPKTNVPAPATVPTTPAPVAPPVTVPQPTTQTAAPTASPKSNELPQPTVDATPASQSSPPSEPVSQPESAPAEVTPIQAAHPVSAPEQESPAASKPVAAVTSPLPAPAPVQPAPALPVTTEILVTKSNSVAPAMVTIVTSGDSGDKTLMIGVGIGLLISAIILGAALLFRSRRPQRSLISDAMRDK